jgi:hypothetical protein
MSSQLLPRERNDGILQPGLQAPSPFFQSDNRHSAALQSHILASHLPTHFKFSECFIILLLRFRFMDLPGSCKPENP